MLAPIQISAHYVVKEGKQQLDEYSEYAKQAARNIQFAFADFLFDPFKSGRLSGMLSGFIDVVRRMIAETAAKKVLESSGMEKFFSGVLDGILGGGLTEQNSSNLSMLAGARATGAGPVSAGSSYLVGERGPELFTPRHPAASRQAVRWVAPTSQSPITTTCAAQLRKSCRRCRPI